MMQTIMEIDHHHSDDNNNKIASSTLWTKKSGKHGHHLTPNAGYLSDKTFPLLHPFRPLPS
jgi:hypothetical protein